LIKLVGLMSNRLDSFMNTMTEDISSIKSDVLLIKNSISNKETAQLKQDNSVCSVQCLSNIKE